MVDYFDVTPLVRARLRFVLREQYHPARNAAHAATRVSHARRQIHGRGTTSRRADLARISLVSRSFRRAPTPPIADLHGQLALADRIVPRAEVPFDLTEEPVADLVHARAVVQLVPQWTEHAVVLVPASGTPDTPIRSQAINSSRSRPSDSRVRCLFSVHPDR
jgi:hypothetical protein